MCLDISFNISNDIMSFNAYKVFLKFDNKYYGLYYGCNPHKPRGEQSYDLDKLYTAYPIDLFDNDYKLYSYGFHAYTRYYMAKYLLDQNYFLNNHDKLAILKVTLYDKIQFGIQDGAGVVVGQKMKLIGEFI